MPILLVKKTYFIQGTIIIEIVIVILWLYFWWCVWRFWFLQANFWRLYSDVIHLFFFLKLFLPSDILMLLLFFIFFNVCLLCAKVPLGADGVGNKSKMRLYFLFHLICLLYKSVCLVWISNVSCCEAFQIKTVILLLKPRIQVLLSSFPKWSL